MSVDAVVSWKLIPVNAMVRREPFTSLGLEDIAAQAT